MEFYSAIKKNKTSFTAALMDLEMITLSKLYRERQIPYDSMYLWNPRDKTNEQTQNRNKSIDTKNRWLPGGLGVEEKKKIKSFF